MDTIRLTCSFGIQLSGLFAMFLAWVARVAAAAGFVFQAAAHQPVS